MWKIILVFIWCSLDQGVRGLPPSFLLSLARWVRCIRIPGVSGQLRLSGTASAAAPHRLVVAALRDLVYWPLITSHPQTLSRLDDPPSLALPQQKSSTPLKTRHSPVKLRLR